MKMGGVAKKSEVQSDASDKTADGSTTAESENKPSVSDAKNADAEKTDNKNDLKVTGLADYKANQTVKGLAESKAAVKPAAKLKATAAGANTEDKVSVPVYFVDSNFNEIDSTVRHSISGKVGTYWNSSNATDDDLSQLNIPDKLYNAGWRYSEQTYDSSKDYKTSFFAQDDLYQKSSIQTEPTKFSTYWFSTNSSNDGLYVKLVHGQEDVTKEHLNDPKIAAVRDYKVVVEKPDGTQQAYDQSFGIVYGQVLRDRVSPNKLTYKEGLRGNKGTFGWAAKDADGNWEVSDTPSNFTNTFAMYGNSYTDWVNQIQKLVNEGKLHGTDNYGNTSSLTADDAQSIIDEIKGALTPEANQFYQGWLAKGNDHEAGLVAGSNQNVELMFGSNSFSVPKIAGYHIEIEGNGTNGLYVNQTIDLSNSSYDGTGIVVSAENGLPAFNGRSVLTLKLNNLAYKDGQYYLAPESQEFYEDYLKNQAGETTYSSDPDSNNKIVGYKGDGYISSLTTLPKSQTIYIRYVKDLDPYVPDTPTTEPVTDSKTITRTINVIDPTTGKTTTTKQTVTLTRSGEKNTTTGETTWGDWRTGEWPEFDAPEFEGYTPSQAVVPDQVVTSDTQDVTITITYTKNKTDQGDKTDPGNKTNQGGSKTNNGGSSKANGSNGNANHAQPAGVSTIAGRQGLSVKAQPRRQAQALPQTNGENNLAVFGWLAAGLTALFGLAGTKRRKHE